MAAKIPLLVITGPTATGKSQLAIELAKRFSGEIISADSMQVYKDMDVGTAKVANFDRQLIPHHLLDVTTPDQDFSLAQYKLLADQAIKSIYNGRKLPIMAGGTGLYIKAVVENYPLADLPFDPECRARLNKEWEEKGRDHMSALLKQVDPLAADKAQDKRRIIRALEVFRLTGRSQSEIQRRSREQSPYAPVIFALTLPRATLYARIDKRSETMVTHGLVEEYSNLVSKGYSPQAKAMQGLGYFHAGMFVTGKWSKEEMIGYLQRDTRRYAKRQLSWFRGMANVEWIDNSRPQQSLQNISDIIAGKALRVSE